MAGPILKKALKIYIMLELSLYHKDWSWEATNVYIILYNLYISTVVGRLDRTNDGLEQRGTPVETLVRR